MPRRNETAEMLRTWLLECEFEHSGCANRIALLEDDVEEAETKYKILLKDYDELEKYANELKNENLALRRRNQAMRATNNLLVARERLRARRGRVGY